MKIYLSGANVVIYERATTVIPAVVPALATDYEIIGPTGQETILVKDINTGAIYSDVFSNIQNEAGATLADLASVTAYLDAFIGSTPAPGGGGSGAGIETWVYKNSDYTPAARLTLSSSSFTETVLSNNVSLLNKTAATDAHDGSKYVFAENDTVKVTVSIKIDANTSASLLRFKIRSKDGNYVIKQTTADTNVQFFGQFLTFDFVPFVVNAGTATAGFDITVSSFTSTADAFIYNITQTVQKIGTNV